MLENDDLARTPILVLANKQDLKDAMKVEELTVALGLHSIRNHEWHIQVWSTYRKCTLLLTSSPILTGGCDYLQACCALSGEGLSDALAWIYQHTRTGNQPGSAR